MPDSSRSQRLRKLVQEISLEKVFAHVQRYGNTSSASMLIAASEWSETNPEPGPVVFSALGAGFHWGALVADSGT
jgi:3-oxoacyl-[acyl-carrier-protein] synthase-3